MIPVAALGPELPPDVRVLAWSLDEPPGGVDPATLSADEEERAARLVTSELQVRWRSARAGLRFALGQRLGLPAGRLRFRLAEGGKPELAWPEAALHFNLSHSGPQALVVISEARRVGVDVEILGRRVEVEHIAARYFTAAEEREVLAAPEGAPRLEVFLRCWTRKEALLKGLGMGIATELRRVDPLGWPGWEVLDLATPTGTLGAVAMTRR